MSRSSTFFAARSTHRACARAGSRCGRGSGSIARQRRARSSPRCPPSPASPDPRPLRAEGPGPPPLRNTDYKLSAHPPRGCRRWSTCARCGCTPYARGGHARARAVALPPGAVARRRAGHGGRERGRHLLREPPARHGSGRVVRGNGASVRRARAQRTRPLRERLDPRAARGPRNRRGGGAPARSGERRHAHAVRGPLRRAADRGPWQARARGRAARRL